MQQDVNQFQINGQWIDVVPGLIFSIYAGHLADRIGYKPLIIVPMIGFTLSAVCGIINVRFIETFPVEMLYLEYIYSFSGGMAVYYLGTYTYGTMVCPPEERAHRIARLDGIETLATLLGTLVSPGAL